MGAGIPLPALDVQAPPQQNPMGNLSQLLQMKGMLGQQQMQQQDIQQKNIALQNSQAVTAAMRNADPNSPTFYDDLARGVLKNGGTADAALGIQQHGLTIRKTVSDIAAQDATTGSKNLETFKQKHQLVGDTLAEEKDIPDAQLHDWAAQQVQKFTQSGIMDPQTAQQAQQVLQSTPDPQALRTQIQSLAKVSMGATAVANQQKTVAETSQANAKAGLDQAQTWLETNKANIIKAYQQNPQQILSQVDAIAPPNGPNAALNARTKSQVQFALVHGDVDGANAALSKAAEQVGAVEKDVAVGTNPQIQANKIATSTAEGQARANVELQAARGSNAALAQVPKELIAPAVSASEKAGADFAQAQSVTQRLNAMMDAAKKGNVVAYQVIPEEGTLQITTSQGVHRINQAEIQQYAGGGSLWQRLMGHVGKTLTGESIPGSVLDDMADIQKIQAQGSRAKYENTLNSINQNYGSTFKPVDMGQGSGLSSLLQPGAKSSTKAAKYGVEIQ